MELIKRFFAFQSRTPEPIEYRFYIFRVLNTIKVFFALIILYFPMLFVMSILPRMLLGVFNVLKRAYASLKLPILKMHFVSILIQIYVFLNIFTLIMSSLFPLHPRFLKHLNDLNDTYVIKNGLTTYGLETVKFWLYENNNLFLLFSTFVLLVALIGAAVLTRKIK